VKTADLIELVAAKAGIAGSAAKETMEAMLAGIIDAARQGDQINLTGFGKFKVARPARVAPPPVRSSRSPPRASWASRQPSRLRTLSPADVPSR
jgi:DNA-binding protein HU-beta